MQFGFQLTTPSHQHSQQLFRNQTAKKPIYPSATATEAGGLASVVVDQHDLAATGAK